MRHPFYTLLALNCAVKPYTKLMGCWLEWLCFKALYLFKIAPNFLWGACVA